MNEPVVTFEEYEEEAAWLSRDEMCPFYIMRCYFEGTGKEYRLLTNREDWHVLLGHGVLAEFPKDTVIATYINGEKFVGYKEEE